jgi:hypothetical protein
MVPYKIIPVIALLLIFVEGVYALENSPQAESEESTRADGENKLQQMSLEEINRQLENPLSRLWSLVFQENLTLLKGDRVENTEVANVFFFQPFLPVPIGRGKMLAARPVFPIVTNPVFSSEGQQRSSGHVAGFGDMQVMSLLGPDKSDGNMVGAGATFKFPTATDDVLGEGKYQAGPAVMFFYLGKPWTVGTLVQHWWSFAGDETRSETSQTDIQYVIRRQIPGAMSIGMGPTISIDWKAGDGNRVTFPIGIGITKTVRWGSVPIKVRFEPQYSVVRPDDIGSTWNFRFQIAPVVPNPF